MAAVAAKKAPQPKVKAPRTRAISLVLEADLLAELDAIAAAESRSRAKQIAVALRRFADDWHAAREGEIRKKRAA